MTALLTAKSDRVEKLSGIINDCHRMGIKVLPPHINKSKSSFIGYPEKQEILFGYSAVKGIGESIISTLIENQPYKNFEDFTTKVQDKTATIALIKAGAFPTSSKMKLLKKYADSLYERKEYKPVSSLPTKMKLLMDWDIDTQNYMVGRKVDKETVLELYNSRRRDKFEKEQDEKYRSYLEEFRLKYAQDEFLWEYESLSMFLTNNPLKEGADLVNLDWDNVADGDKTVVLCVIADIKRKKDKNNNQFAYLDLITQDGIVEATIWSKHLKKYSSLIEKGKCLAVLGRKEENHLFVQAVKPYTQWLTDIQKRRKRA